MTSNRYLPRLVSSVARPGLPAQASGSINNTVDVSGLITRTTFTNRATASVVVVQSQVDLNISKTGTANPVAGAPFQYTLTVGNSGLQTANGVEVRPFSPAVPVTVALLYPPYHTRTRLVSVFSRYAHQLMQEEMADLKARPGR